MYDRLYGGDFRGLIDKLTYLKELGVTAIYLNPVFVSHNSHKYNARTYVHADDGYGVAGSYAGVKDREDLLDPATWEFNASDRALLELIREVHARDMRIIFDGVWNQVGDDHPAFLDVRKNGKESRYADWFNVVSWDPFVYRGWAGFDGLPEFAKSPDGLASESAKAHIFAVTRRWMDPNGDGDPSDGIDGWRLDVPMDVPMGFWVKWCAHVRSINPDAYITGEVWDPAEEWLDGQTFDAVMNYQLPKAAFPWFANAREKITASEFDRRLALLRIRYPRNHTYVLQNLFDSHDTDRWVSRIVNPDLPYDGANRRQDEDGAAYNDARPPEEAYRRLRLMALFQSTYVGAPMIWYGTEVGMYGADDPMCRMPMWWDDMEPFDTPDYRVDKDLREEFRALFHLRQREPLLRRGDYRTAIADDDKDVFGYWRHDPADRRHALLVLLNNSAKELTVEFPTRARKIRLLHATPGTLLPSADGTRLSVTLPPIGGLVIAVE
jgi:glycosidase